MDKKKTFSEDVFKAESTDVTFILHKKYSFSSDLLVFSASTKL